MSGDTTPDTATAPKPLLPLLDAAVAADDDAAPAASRCCGGGSCSLG